MSQLMIFEDLTYEELKKLYEDMLEAANEGLRPRSLDPYIQRVKEQFHYVTIADAWKCTEELFYDEVSRRFFNIQKAPKIPVFSGIAAETGEEVSGNALTFEDGEIRIAISCIVDSDIPDLLAVVARKIVDNSVKRIT